MSAQDWNWLAVVCIALLLIGLAYEAGVTLVMILSPIQ